MLVNDRRERLAVNLEDVERIDPSIRAQMIAGKIDAKTTIQMPQFSTTDEGAIAVAFVCDALTAATICDVLRSNDRACGDQPTRIYINKGKGWTRVSGVTALTVVVDDDVQLNPSVFEQSAVVTGPPPPVKALNLGSRLV